MTKKEVKRLLRGWEKPSEAIYATLTSIPIYGILEGNVKEAKTRRMKTMEKKELELLEKRLGRKVDVNFIRECKEAFLQSEKSGELARLTRERAMPMKVTPQKQPEKS